MSGTEDKEYYSISKYARAKDEGRIEVDFSVYLNTKLPALMELIDKPAAELEALRKDSKEAEETALRSIELTAADEWAKHAAQTMLLKKALEYVRTMPVTHTSNKWAQHPSNKDNYEISNMVYKMTYQINERTVYNHRKQKSEPVAWLVSWRVSFNAPQTSNNYYRSGTTIADQHDKRYADKAAADKYLQGRIAAYAHLFTEISPPIPEDKTELFTINGILLPGYTVAAHEPTPDELLDFIGEADLTAPTPTQKETPAQRSAAKKQAHNRHVKGR